MESPTAHAGRFLWWHTGPAGREGTRRAARRGGQGRRETPRLLLFVTATPGFSPRRVCFRKNVARKPACWALPPEHLTCWEPLAPATPLHESTDSAPRATSTQDAGRRRHHPGTEPRQRGPRVNMRVNSDMELPRDTAFLLHEQGPRARGLRGLRSSQAGHSQFHSHGRGHWDRTLRSPAAQGDRPHRLDTTVVGGGARSAW